MKNDEERNNNKVIKIYFVITRTRANSKDIINEVSLLAVENNLLPLIPVIDTNIRSTIIDKYFSTYIKSKDTVILTTLRIMNYYDS